jgi:hypothetical protein
MASKTSKHFYPYSDSPDYQSSALPGIPILPIALLTHLPLPHIHSPTYEHVRLGYCPRDPPTDPILVFADTGLDHRLVVVLTVVDEELLCCLSACVDRGGSIPGVGLPGKAV